MLDLDRRLVNIILVLTNYMQKMNICMARFCDRPNVKYKKGSKKKIYLQHITIFHLLKQGGPLIDYECMQRFFEFLKVEKILKMHRTNSSGWGILGLYSIPFRYLASILIIC